MKTLLYGIKLARPNNLDGISTTEEYVRAYLAKPSNKGELAHKYFHHKMETFLKGELEHLLKVGWQPPRKIKLEMTILED